MEVELDDALLTAQPCEDQVKNVWKESLRRSTMGHDSEQVRVVPTGPELFYQQPLVLTPGETLNLLGRPLRVLLENGRYDRAFLLAFADAATLKALVDAEGAGWLVFETAGGIRELEVRAEDAATNPVPREVFRTMYLCDSDARLPGKPEGAAVKVGNALAFLAKQYHRQGAHLGRVLARRAAENYAPPSAVRAWAAKKFGHRALWRSSGAAGR